MNRQCYTNPNNLVTFKSRLSFGLKIFSLFQVKVWFQNRRTKHKRMQQEEEAKTSGNGNKSGSPNSQNSSQPLNKWKEENSDEYGEYIDMDMEEDCVSDVESDT